MEQLRGLPDALIVTDDDILQEEGEEYAYRAGAGGGAGDHGEVQRTFHDFAMLNPLADTPATRGAVGQAIAHLRAALHA